MDVTRILPSDYDHRLLFLSMLLSILGTYLYIKLVKAGGRPSLAWRLTCHAGAVAVMMSAIWSTAYAGMRAHHFSPLGEQHLLPLLASWLSALMCAAAIFHATRQKKQKSVSFMLGSLACSVGFFFMHACLPGTAPRYRQEQLLTLVLFTTPLSYIILTWLRSALLVHLKRIGQLMASISIGITIAVAINTYICVPDLLLNSSSAADWQRMGFGIGSIIATVLITILMLNLVWIIPLLRPQAKPRNMSIKDEWNMLRALIDNIPEYMYVKDIEHRYVAANSSLAGALGLASPDQLIGKSDADFFPSELAATYRADEAKILQSGQGRYNQEESSIDRDGNPVLILTTKVPVKKENGEIFGIAGVGRDISSHKKMEMALREAELKYRGIFNKAVIGIFQCSPEGHFLSVNPSMAFSFGYASPEEMVATVVDLSAQFFANRERGEEFMMIMNKVGAVKNFECEAFCQDGSKIWLTMSVRSIRKNGAIIRFEGICDDISERMQMREQFLQTQKLESVGQLAAGIAHEINTPTQFIGDNVRFLKDSFGDLRKLLISYAVLLDAARDGSLQKEMIESVTRDVEEADTEYLVEEIPKAIEQTLEGVGRVATLVSAMKEFSHPGTKEKVYIDLNHAIASTIEVSRNEWKYAARMETFFDESLSPIACLPSEFNQVILNMIVNAAHAITDAASQGSAAQGLIRITTRNLVDEVEITIADTSTGIPEEARNRIFDPFFTTKEIGKGTGQGLAIARSVIVDKHGGSIHFETTLGKGTTFFIRLPRNGRLNTRSGTLP